MIFFRQLLNDHTKAKKVQTVKRQASAESLASTGFFWRTTKVNDKLVSIDAVFKSLSDHKTLVLFDTIAHSDSYMDSPISNLEFTKKHYSRIHSLTNSGLITRQNGKYYLASFGKIVSFYYSRIARALDKF